MLKMYYLNEGCEYLLQPCKRSTNRHSLHNPRLTVLSSLPTVGGKTAVEENSFNFAQSAKCSGIEIKLILILLSPPETLLDPWEVPGPTLATTGI